MLTTYTRMSESKRKRASYCGCQHADHFDPLGAAPTAHP
jgi:hypothetical protein